MIVPAGLKDPNNLVLVIFSGETDIRWLRILKPGFRHCFACLHKNGQWIFYDPLANKTELSVLAGMDSIDLEFWFRQRGCTVVRTHSILSQQQKLRPSFFTCVEATKRLLGIHNGIIITPWQLYKHLMS
jgi:hypothetical protein